MKPTLELLELEKTKKSFNFFKIEAENFDPYWHFHPELELTLITKGKGTRFVGTSIEPYSKFDLVLVGSNLPHHWVSLKEEGSTKQQAFVIQFPKHIFNGFYEGQLLNELFKKAAFGIQFLKPDAHLIKSIIEFDTQNKVGQFGTLTQILNILNTDFNVLQLSSIEYNSNHLNTNNQKKVNKVVSYILQNLDKKLSVNVLSKHTHMVPQSFCRWFKKTTGNSFITFLNTSRIERYCQYLISTDAPIQQIAFDCGFESLSHFNRTFKKTKSTNPRDFRNSMQS
jgi:AraC-like DNA-binding protein